MNRSSFKFLLIILFQFLIFFNSILFSNFNNDENDKINFYDKDTIFLCGFGLNFNSNLKFKDSDKNIIYKKKFGENCNLEIKINSSNNYSFQNDRNIYSNNNIQDSQPNLQPIGSLTQNFNPISFDDFLYKRPDTRKILEKWDEMTLGQKMKSSDIVYFDDEKDFLNKVLQSDPEFKNYCVEIENQKKVQQAEQERILEKQELEKKRKIEQEKLKV